MNILFLFYLGFQALIWTTFHHVRCVPFISMMVDEGGYNKSTDKLRYLPFLMMSHLEKAKDTSEFWRDTEILSLVEKAAKEIDYEMCEKIDDVTNQVVKIPSTRTLEPMCRSSIDYQLCPQCAHFTNRSICELFRDNCKEQRVRESEYRTYCERKYGPWRTMFLPADVTQCRCCDECVFYRELDQSCMRDEYYMEIEEFSPVTTIDFRAGCNPYWGHPEQDIRALRCDKVLRRCVPVNVPSVPNHAMRLLVFFGVFFYVLFVKIAGFATSRNFQAIQSRRNFRYDPPPKELECPTNCLGYKCPNGGVKESNCAPGAFLPDKNQCNCCGQCSNYQQLNQKCADVKKIVIDVNGTKQIEVEEEFLEPGCDDGLVCRKGRCQDVHAVLGKRATRREMERPFEPCKEEMRFFKKKYGANGHLHFEAPQCTPLWLYSSVQCRRFVCYCALEDGTRIEGINVPRAEVSNMNCDCAREKCRTKLNIECDGYGNYKEVVFTQAVDFEGGNSENLGEDDKSKEHRHPAGVGHAAVK